MHQRNETIKTVTRLAPRHVDPPQADALQQPHRELLQPEAVLVDERRDGRLVLLAHNPRPRLEQQAEPRGDAAHKDWVPSPLKRNCQLPRSSRSDQRRHASAERLASRRPSRPKSSARLSLRAASTACARSAWRKMAHLPFTSCPLCQHGIAHRTGM